MTTAVYDKPTSAAETAPYLAAQAAFLARQPTAPAWLQRLRRTAAERFAQLGFPGPRTEDWRFTSVAPLRRVSFRLAEPADAHVEAAFWMPHRIADSIQLVFVHGRFAPQWSHGLEHLPAGVTLLPLAEALRTLPERLEPHLGRYAPWENQAFIALNTSFLEEGVFLALEAGTVLERPLHLLFLTPPRPEPVMSFPRVLVLAGAGSRLTLLESFLGPPESIAFTNAVREVVLQTDAAVDHYQLLEAADAGFHYGALQAHLERGSNFTSHAILLSGGWVRNETRAVLAGERTVCTLNGLYLASGRQHMDNHTVIEHAQPHGTSHELYKGILDGQAHGVFNGKIHVRPGAQKTDAKQTNQTLLLSDEALIDTKPQLEIFADDVKCTHGATVGQLDADALFYLRTRGLDAVAAQALLTYAFANDIVQRIQIPALRVRLEQELLARQHLPLAQELDIGALTSEKETP
jgi:Fe-S cluster assembly protein SufD